jgi:hypothetical protein
MQSEINGSEVIEKVKKLLGLDSDSDLARYFQVSRQQVSQYKKTKEVRLQHMLIGELLKRLETQETSKINDVGDDS